MLKRKSTTGTKKKILQVASVLFSQKGFRATTIADICRLAGTNIASVNYHFGDKKTLYVEAWRESFRHSHEKHPPDGGVAADAPAEERLRGWVASLLRRITDPDCYDFEIVHMEMVNPTGHLFDAFKEVIDPMGEGLVLILGQLLGKKASDDDIRLCEMSIRSQCMNPMVFGKRHKGSEQNLPLPRPPSLDVEVERIADHVIRFTLEGLPGVRRHIEARKHRHNTSHKTCRADGMELRKNGTKTARRTAEG